MVFCTKPRTDDICVLSFCLKISWSAGENGCYSGIGRFYKK